ncbi:oxidoreductase [Hydrogenophaga laconesensis]|uniref:2,4-dienoyl-CoA reductase-like NADH-dependent reductase (Old Yellow Enzyme family)/siroheme synthase (Precorrin-2 oxidase/ferrochelatase) n=1 Tax=Hydrogenophaga laconesensis TaxID=1805971 RepID=A0ABU1VJJ5_9BURK|nr:FAD-dependent oxidoreductase [Hydrogenophaga laconesensis]MDR7097463.1 2,4-dienoyl-CoA reductase-like NADH-dependent reductase (Old Yellow Enzyme family)/siroheme synthase (precorrin-2 oxidase/ferrochelatase) [Hydrogenophaga laconesensis]
MSHLPELFQPMQIGPMSVANRIMMSGMSAGSRVHADGSISDETIAYYVERARTSPGMMAVGAAAVVPPSPEGPQPRQSGSAGLKLYLDEMIPSFARLVDAVHRHDTRFGIQLFNGGGTERGRHSLISPSGLSSNVRDNREPGRQRSGQINRALETSEIPDIVTYYAEAADRCRQAGFDFVEIHAGHGYLISNFLTPLFNRRTDRYGGSFDNRVRFLLEIVDAVKHRVGGRIAVGVKFNGDDFIGEDGWQLKDAVRLGPLLASAGADYLTVTAGLIGADRLTIPPMYEPQGCYVDMAEAVKERVSIPVASVGRIKDPRMARDLIARGRLDFVVLGRAFIADSEFVQKTREGRLEDIRPCLADCRGCADEHIQRGGMTSCVVNPRMCRERDLVDVEGSASAQPKKVVVVGGGLAGLEAARRCAFSGHQVTLCEAREQLGGQIVLAAKMPGRQELGDILPWYERQLQRHGVEVRLGTRVGEPLLKALAPDVLIVATGSVPQVPANMLDAVMSADDIDIVMLDDLIDEDLPVGKKVLVIGGDQNGVVVADWLAEKGVDVCIAESSPHLASKLAGHDRWYLLNRIGQKGVRRIKNVSGMGVAPGGRVRLQTRDGENTLEGVQTVVFASERKADRALVELASKMGITAHVVGDAHDATSEHAGTIFATIARAYDVARVI